MNLKSSQLKIVSDIILFMIIFIFFAFILRYSSLRSMDEIWCYGFSNRVLNGYIIYKDFNLIITPLFVVMGSLFAHSLFMFRLFGAFISVGILFLIYYSFKKKNIGNFNSFLFMAVAGIFLLLSVPFANYNLMLLLGLLLAFNIANIYFRKLNYLSSFTFGFSLAITWLIKQNIPTFLIIIFFCLVAYQWISKKIPLQTFVLFVLGVGLPIGTFIGITLLLGSFGAFLDYCFFGLKSFSSLSNLQSGSQFLILFSMTVTSLVAVRFMKSRENKYQYSSTFIFSICSYLFVFPLIDLYHSLLLLIFHIALSSSLISNVKFVRMNIIMKALIASGLLLIIVFAAFSYYVPGSEGYIRSKNTPYQDIYVSVDLEKNISNISEYIVNKETMGLDVAIIDGTAYLYNLAANDYNGILDLLNTGNVGTKTNEEIISMINQKDIILAAKNYKWQDMQVFKDYVEAYYIKSGTIGDKIIYIKR